MRRQRGAFCREASAWHVTQHTRGTSSKIIDLGARVTDPRGSSIRLDRNSHPHAAHLTLRWDQFFLRIRHNNQLRLLATVWSTRYAVVCL